MSRSIINKKLYVDSLVQLKTIGVIFSIASVFISLILPVVMFFERISSGVAYFTESNGYVGSAGSRMAQAPHIAFAVPSLYIVMFLGSIVFVMVAFSFLNKRNASDFYHSLPNSRTATFTSVTAAVLTWIYAIILGTILITWLAYTVLGLPFNPLHVPYLIATFFAGSTLVAASAIFASAITGTGISTFAVTLIILYVPRIVMSVFTIVLLTLTRLVPPNSLNMFFDQSINIPYGLSVGIAVNAQGSYGDPVIQMFSSAGAMIYTTVLALIYLVIGCYLFNRRKSETAEKSAPNRAMQHLFRIGVTLPVLLLISMIVGAAPTDRWVSRSIYIAIIIIALVINVVYELITTRRFKNVLKSLPLFVVSILFVFGLGFVANKTASSIARTKVNGDKLEYVRFITNKNSYSGIQSNFSNAYARDSISKIKVSDQKIFAKLSQRYNDYVDQKYFDAGDLGRVQVTVEFKEKGKSPYTRSIEISQSDNLEIISSLASVSGFEEAYKKLPEDKDIYTMSINEMTLKDDENKAIWESYKKEVVNLSVFEYSNILNGNSNNIVGSLHLTIAEGITNYYITLPITDELPLTSALYIKTVNSKSTHITDITNSLYNKIDEAAKEVSDNANNNTDNSVGNSVYDAILRGNVRFNLNLLVVDSNRERMEYNSYADYNYKMSLDEWSRKKGPDELDVLESLNLLKRCYKGETNVDLSKPYVRFNVYAYAPKFIFPNGEYGWWEGVYEYKDKEVNETQMVQKTYIYYVNISEEEVQQIKQLSKDMSEE